MNYTARKSWVASANDPACDFPVQNLPYGVFSHQDRIRIGVAIGDQVLDLQACARRGLLRSLSAEVVDACESALLNPLMSLGRITWSALRQQIIALLDEDQADASIRRSVEKILVPMRGVTMQMPARIGDYTDFYASIDHATRVGKLFRPDNPLPPNYKYIPIGYHGRASSIIVSGKDIPRPCGQTKRDNSGPAFGPTQSLDYELEVGAFIGPGNPLGQPIPIAEAEGNIFGLCLVNDWSARDIQSWEYQPLGPFLAKSFATTISPWIVPIEALESYRVPLRERGTEDPEPLPYLRSPSMLRDGIDLTVEAYLQSQKMREAEIPKIELGRANLRDLYWSLPQLVAHHSSNGCNLRPGDLIATGTISGTDEGSLGCLLERTLCPDPLQLPNGELRTFLEDGDTVSFLAYAQADGLPRIGFGECSGTIFPALSTS